jgi:apolipoprotein N-acyltransferase
VTRSGLERLTYVKAVGIAALAVLLELLIMPVMPATIALGQARVGGMMLLSSLTGIWGVALAVWLANLVGAAVWLKALPPKQLGFTVAPIAALLILGLIPRSTAADIKVGVVQSDSDDSATMMALSRRGGARLVVWPEFGGLAFSRDGHPTELLQISRAERMPAIATSYPDEFRPRPHNTASLFSKGVESERYYKRRLFGGEKNMHTPGTAPATATWQVPIGLNICFDSCFPDLLRSTARNDNPPIIALPTIDPDSPHGFLAAMHAAYTPFRAAELGVSVLRADAHAHSMIVAPTGQVLAELSTGAVDTAVALVPSRSSFTLYKLLGDWLFLPLILMVVFGLFPPKWKHRGTVPVEVGK